MNGWRDFLNRKIRVNKIKQNFPFRNNNSISEVINNSNKSYR